jgi:hypothetical protein
VQRRLGFEGVFHGVYVFGGNRGPYDVGTEPVSFTTVGRTVEGRAIPKRGRPSREIPNDEQKRVRLFRHEQARGKLGPTASPQRVGGLVRADMRREVSPAPLILATAKRLIDAGTPRHDVNRQIVDELAAAGRQVKLDTVRKVRFRARRATPSAT